MPRLTAVPGLDRLRMLPAPTLRVIALLVGVNLLVWAAVAVVLHFHPILISPAVLSYTLGLRHALDADHISVRPNCHGHGQQLLTQARPLTS